MVRIEIFIFLSCDNSIGKKNEREDQSVHCCRGRKWDGMK